MSEKDQGALGLAGKRFGTLAERLAALIPPLLLICLGGMILAAQGGYLIDDSYITFRYAANLAAGHGLVWNPGVPVEGYTNLLWVLLLAPFAWLKIDLVLPAAGLSCLAAIGCLEVLRRISREIWPERSLLIHAAPGVLLAANPSFAYWAVQGMETPLFALLILLAVQLTIRSRQQRRLRWWAGAVLSAAYLTRPEGALVAFVLVICELSAARGQRWQRLRELSGPALLFFATAGAHFAFRLSYYGELLPNTFYAKVIWGWITMQRGGHHLGSFLLAGGWMALPGVLIAHRSKRPLLRAYLQLGYALFLSYGVYLLLIGGDFPWWYRFYVPLLPLPALGLVGLLLRLGEELQRRWRRLTRSAAPLRLAALGAALVLTAAPLSCSWQKSEVGTIPMVRSIGDNYRALILFFFRKVPQDSYVAASAVGMLAYYTPLRILDTWGLNNKTIARRDVKPDPKSVFAHDKSDWIYVLSQLPDYILTHQPLNIPQPPLLPGYDLCWPTFEIPYVLLYRRNIPLAPAQRQLGAPPGQKRQVLPPPCFGRRPSMRPVR